MPKFVFALANLLYNYAFPVYTVLYFAFKRNNDKAEIKLIKKIINKDDIVVEVGANIGFYTSIISSLIGEKGILHVFEPEPTNFKHLLSITHKLKNVKANNMAVSDKRGTLNLFTSTLLNVDHRTYPVPEYGKVFSVEADSIDNYLKENNKVDFVKMDIQGSEMFALRGMEKTLDANPQIKILTEIEPYGLNASGSSVDEFYDFITAKKFKVYLIKNNTLVALRDFEEVKKKKKKDSYYNILLTRTEI
jgi:FkbM family methyltransferase